MAIRTVVTRGYGNGTFNGTIGLVSTRGYLPAVFGPACITAVNLAVHSVSAINLAAPSVSAVNLAVPSVSNIWLEACE